MDILSTKNGFRKIKWFFLGILSLSFLSSCQKDKEEITYKPIGYFSTNFNRKTGAPRQGILMKETKGIIILDEKYTEALKDLDRFEYIFVLYHFHKAIGWDSFVQPPESDHTFGLFATRSPRRPNPVGLSLIKLDSVKHNKLYVSGIDAFDGTPVIDIKPFLPSVDNVISIKNMETEIYLGHHDEEFINDSLVPLYIEGKKEDK